MKVILTVPAIGDVNEYIGIPILDKMPIYKFDENCKPIGVITKILENNGEDVLVEAEIWDRFIDVQYEMSIKNDNKQLNLISLNLK
ncbi:MULTISPECIES: hypothetical protein [unclassified Clostridium]|uniref:hypothetical protein n=1 Tax=unclassified Clostridium TaxID=2614128 RepID=UPI0025C5A0D2|nr:MULTISPECIES: hypothetical protein [unclassified Clostridium]